MSDNAKVLWDNKMYARNLVVESSPLSTEVSTENCWIALVDPNPKYQKEVNSVR